MRFVCVLIFLLGAFSVQAQNCTCTDEFNFTVNYFEKNHPGFQDFSKSEKKKYQRKLRALRNEIKKSNPETECIFYLQRYLWLLQDNHLSVTPNIGQLKRVNEKDAAELEAFLKSDDYKNTERLGIDSAAIVAKAQQLGDDEITGIYNLGTKVKFAIISNKRPGRDFAGVVIHSESALWEPGMVMMEISKARENYYHITLTTSAREKISLTGIYKDGRIPAFGLSKSGYQKTERPLFEFSTPNENTSYISIRSFDGEYYSLLDSFYNANDPTIRSRPNLIIDVRDNEGGSQQSYAGLLPYFYTSPLKQDIVDVWVSSDVISLYEASLQRMLADSQKHSPVTIENTRKLIARMKQSEPDKFMPQSASAPEPIVLDSGSRWPERIVVLQNRATASSAEAFILHAKQSSKVVTAGSNTGGYLGYGNVMQVTTPCGKYNLGITTTRYRYNSQFEFVGIPPTHSIPADADWIEYALKLLNQEYP